MLDASLVDITHLPPLLSGPLFAILFWWLATALGYRLLRLFGVPVSGFTVWEHGLVSAALGTGLLQLLPLTLSVFGRLRPFEIGIGFAVLVVVLSPDLVRIARRFVAEVSHLPVREIDSVALAWGAVFVLFMGVLLVYAVTFGVLGDDDGIHLAAPKRWLAAGTLSYLPTYSLTNATMGFDVLYLLAIAVWSPIGAKMLHYSAGVCALLALVLCARRIASYEAGLLAISVLLIATPVVNVPPLFGNAMIDLAACWMTMMSVLIWLVWREEREPKLLVCMALCAGFAASYKLTSMQIGIAWLPILAVDAWRRHRTWQSVARPVIVFGLVMLAAVLPWLVRNALLTGNPLYPMLSSLIPTRDWPAEHAQVFSLFVRYYSWGVASGSQLDEGERRTLVLIAAALVAAGGGTTAFFLRNPVTRSLIAFATMFTLISTALTGLIFRYWLPATMCVVLVFSVLCAQRWPRRLLVPALILMLTAGAVHARRGFYFHRPTRFIGDFRMATGLSTFEREYANEPLVKAWKYINASTPRDARILFGAFYTTFSASSYAGFWVDRTCFTTDSHVQAYLPLDDFTSFRNAVFRAGVTHVMFADEQFSPDRFGFSFQAGRNEYPFVRRLAEEFGQQVYQAAFVKIYQLRPEPLRQSAENSLAVNESQSSHSPQ